ncbi:MAG: hypothetical protein AAF805_01885 [Planctomycetota bacterium]
MIGVDIGSAAIKVAQLSRRGDALSLSAAAICPRAGEDGGLAATLRAVRTLASGMRGVRVAAMLSMQACGLDATAESEDREADRTYGCWQTPGGEGYRVHASLRDVETVVEGCASAGLQCEVLDGAPLAIARATPLASGDPDELVGALDWGERAVTFVASKRGEVLYARRLAGDGFDSARAAVSETLGLSPSESAAAIRRHGLDTGSPAGRLVADAVRRSIRPTLTELSRTLNHLSAKLKTRGPERLVVLGGAATTPGVPEEIERRVELATAPWSADGLDRTADVAAPDCLLGPAIALSALAWERAA